METPSGLYVECPNCGRVPHRVIRGRISSGEEIVLDGVVKCLRCGFTRRETYRERALRTVPLIVSYKKSSERTSLELSPSEVVRVGDRFDVEQGKVEVTSIEVEGRRVVEAVAQGIGAVWSKLVDRVEVKFSINKGRKTLSYSLEVPPDEEFEVGALLKFGKERCVIHRLKTTRGLLKKGRATASEIRRVYCKGIRSRRPSRGSRRPRR
ncbi:MAG: HVO_0476 family zinc finger protein [Thermoplasmata archaeon]